jgi:predicted transcriptional regulator
MTRLLEMAVEAARQLSPEEQDELARTILAIVNGEEDGDVYVLSDEENAAIDRGLAELERGEYVTMEEVQAVLAKYRR